jgi:hypothetical protein
MDNEKSYVPEGKPYKYCSNCGAKIDLNAEVCPACGVAQTVVKSSSNTSGTLDLGAHKNPEVDSRGLAKLKLGALMSIVGLILTMIPAYFLAGSLLAITSLVGSSSSSSTSTLAGISAGTFAGMGIAVIAGAILFLISIIEYRHAFGILKESNPSLTSPYSLMKWIYIGLILEVILIPLSLIVILITISSSASSSSSGSFVGTIAVIGLIGFISLIAGIMSLVGYIGMIMGLYRSGEVFDEGVMKVGAILYIIPYLNIIAPILIYIGALSAGKQMSR